MLLGILFASHSNESNGDVTMTSITLWRHVNIFSHTDCSDNNIFSLTSVTAGYVFCKFDFCFWFLRFEETKTKYALSNGTRIFKIGQGIKKPRKLIDKTPFWIDVIYTIKWFYMVLGKTKQLLGLLLTLHRNMSRPLWAFSTRHISV